MSEVIIYHNGECSKSKGALEILQELGVPHSIRYYLLEPLSRVELETLLKKLGIKAEQLVRKSEDLYKEKYQDKELSDSEWIDILVENPVLIERPIVEKDGKAVVARPPERLQEVL
jgi:arsenate reductase (glutaredoxin)